MSDIDGYAADLAYATATNETSWSNFTTLGGLTNIGGPEYSREAINCGDFDSTNKIEEFIPGMIDEGEVTADLNYDGTSGGTASKLATLKTAAVGTWTIRLNDHTSGGTSRSGVSFAGFLTGLGHAIPKGDKVTQNLRVKVAGAVTHHTTA
jgi:hypothetical protein